jgi:hypothetical protein
MYAEFWKEQLKERDRSEGLDAVGKILNGSLKFGMGRRILDSSGSG